MNSKHLASLALALAAATTGDLAQARDVNAQWGVTISGPVLSIPLPPPPPLPVFRHRPSVVVVPAPVVHQHHRRGWRDSDRDGIPNRYDRVDNRRFDRDGDGIPNRYDRHDNRRDGWRGR